MTPTLSHTPMFGSVRLTLRGRGIACTAELQKLVGKRLLSAIGRFARRIRAITVVLEDENGPRGGIDQRCRIDIRLKREGRLRTSGRALSQHAAIAQAALRARTILVHKFKRMQTKRQVRAGTARYPL